MKSSSRSNWSVRLGVEALESRLTPAGNLNAFVANGTLVLQADRYSHVIDVQVYDDRVVVRALDSTRINGERPPTDFASATFFGDANTISALVFDGNSSDDSISIQTFWLTAERNLDITAHTHGGRDFVSVNGGMIAGNIYIDSGAGYDNVWINGDYPDVLLGIDLGAGNDTLRVTGSIGAVSMLDSAGGKDVLEVPGDFYSAFADFATGFETVRLT